MEGSTSKRASPSEPPRTKKRAKYTQLACNECKRRKLKCDGEPICGRCLRQNTQCTYTPNSHASGNIAGTPSDDQIRDDRLSTRFRTVDQHIEALQREMRAMATRMRHLESTAGTPNNTTTSISTASSSSANIGLQRIMNRPLSPDYIGPTSAEFGLTARQKRSDDSDYDESESTGAPSPAAGSDVEAMSADHPLGCLGKAEALRLVTVYEDTVGVMYPCIDLDSVRSYVMDFYGDVDRPGPTSPEMTDQDWFFARDAEVLKILLATALLAESHGRSERAALLADNVEDRFAARLKVPEVDMKELVILTLLSIFHSYRDDEVISWRVIGLAVRGSMQLGLHRQETWQRTGGVFPGELQWTWASRLWWCIYVLDRKWSFGTGLPFAIQDSDMDTNLPEPGAATPYLTCMISYARLSTKIWGLVMGWRSRPRAATADYCSYLDFQVQQWIQSIPHELRFDPSPSLSTTVIPNNNPSSSLSHHNDSSPPSPPEPQNQDRMTMLQVLLALQANQLRILVYRQNLLTTESIESNIPGASIAVETAKSTVHMLDYFSQVSDIYFQRPEPFNYFLISALAALFLAVLHAPVHFSQVCRGEFYAAVDMVRRSSTRARTSRRLQKIIRSLKLIRLNLDGRSPGRGKVPRKEQHKDRDSRGRQMRDASSQDRFRLGLEESTPVSSIGDHIIHSESRDHHQHQRHPNTSVPGGLPTPQPSGSLWSTVSSPIQHYTVGSTAAIPIGGEEEEQNNSCEDLTSFFEMAGGLYFDPRMEGSGNDGLSAPSVGGARSEGIDAFQAEDEALTRVIAGLL